MQDGQAALVVYNCEIRNLQQQMVTLKNNMEELKLRSCEAKGGRAEEVAKATFGTCQVLFEDVINPNHCNRT